MTWLGTYGTRHSGWLVSVFGLCCFAAVACLIFTFVAPVPSAPGFNGDDPWHLILPASLAMAGGLAAWLGARRAFMHLAPALRLPALLLGMVAAGLAVDWFSRWAPTAGAALAP